MVLAFLKCEIDSARFGGQLRKILGKYGLDEDIIRNGDLLSPVQNEIRAEILGEFRGYPDRDIFENYPRSAVWKFVRFSEDDLDCLRFVDYSYWNELSRGSSKPSDAAASVRGGIEIFGQSNRYFTQGAEFLGKGRFPPMILLTCNSGKYLILEGHCRAVSYALCPEKFAGSEGFAGFCSEADLMKKAPHLFSENDI